MAGRWPLVLALGSIEREGWSSTPFDAVGVIEPAGGDLVDFHFRMRLVASAAKVRRSDFDPGGLMDQQRALWDLGPFVRVPTGPDGAEFYGACRSSSADAGAVERLAERLAAVSAAGEPMGALEDRLRRVDALADVLQTLESALDLRDAFSRLSENARRVLPHDFSIVALHEDGKRRIRRHALSAPEGWTIPEVVDNPYPTALSETWSFIIHHDLQQHPFEQKMPSAALGMRSSVRVPIRVDEQTTGSLDFSAFEPHWYNDADVLIARRIGAYVALALSHRKLADEARQAAGVRERAKNLDLLDGLLTTLTGALDVRDVFDRVSAVSHKVMTHDAMSISIPTDDGRQWTIHVATGYMEHLPTPYVMNAPTPRLLDTYWDFELVDDMAAHRKYDGTPSVQAGMRALLSIPVWVDGRLRATVNFYSREPGHFTKDDVLLGRRIADHIALALSHQRLVEASRRRAELQARASRLDLVDDLLATVTDQGELVDVFDRISTFAKRVLAHDLLILGVVLSDGAHLRPYARAGERTSNLPEVVKIPAQFLDHPRREYDLVEDVETIPERQDEPAARLGYRSALRVPIRLDGELTAVVTFLAFAPGSYTQDDVQVARRIADRLTLAASRTRGLQASKRADEATARASQLESRVKALTEELDARTGSRRVVGDSLSWRQALTQATQVAATDTTVLLLGESGTGKEVIARFVHRASARRDGPFVALNCAALPEQLLEAELFGYERGAFTGATQSKPGQLEQAGGGTLFLDEVGEMALPAQAKFLRVLQEREFQRLGGTRVLKSDARIVAATNRDLPRAIAQGTFREDLFYRLNVFAIRLPPLRDRRDDILLLSEAFLADIARGLGSPPSGIARDARAALLDYHWPGNARELRNILERAAILCEGGLITREHLAIQTGAEAGEAAVRVEPAAAVPVVEAAPATAGDLRAIERTLIEQALRNARFNKSRAAAALGITRAQLYVRMKRYGLE